MFHKKINKLNGSKCIDTVKIGDKEQIGGKELFPVTNMPIYFIRLRNIWH